MFAKFILDNNYGIDKDGIRKAVDYIKSEYEEEHERDIKDMIQDDDYKSPWINKYATVATGLKTVTYLSDSDKKPAARNEPMIPNPVTTGYMLVGPSGKWQTLLPR